jgi:hypothetical protein
VPAARWSSQRAFAARVARTYGVGILEVGSQVGGLGVREEARPELNRKAGVDWLRGRLRPEHKTFAEAGNAQGKAWTPFQATCRALQELAASNKNLMLKAAIDQIDHHYASNSSARSSLKKWIDKGVVPGIALERRGRGLYVVWKGLKK